MTVCESNCFYSINTLLNVIAGAFIGAVVITLIGCFISGTLAFTDAGVTCAITVTAGVVGGWVVGAIIGAVLAAVMSYFACKERCVGAEAVPADEIEQGLTADSDSGLMTCAQAKTDLKRAEDILGEAEEREAIRRVSANRAAMRARHARTAVHLSGAAIAAGLIWSAPVLLAGVIFTTLTALVHRQYGAKAAKEGVIYLYTVFKTKSARYRNVQAQKLVDTLCGQEPEPKG